MEHKQTEPIILNTDETQGIVEAIWAVMGNIDGGNDIIHPGAFKKTFSERADQVNLLDNHRTDSVMASLGNVLELREMSKAELPSELTQKYPEATGAAWGRFQFLLDTPEGKGAFTRIRQKSVKGWSFGYDTVQRDHGSVEKDGHKVSVRNLRELKLYEVSPVLFAMNEATLTTGVKAQEVESPEDDKAGRVLSARNATRIKEAMDSLHQCLMDAGLMEMPEEEGEKDGWLCDVCYKRLSTQPECFTDANISAKKCEHCGEAKADHHVTRLPKKNGATGPQKSDNAPTSDSEAGPLEDDSTRIKTLIQIEQEALKLLEVQSWRP